MNKIVAKVPGKIIIAGEHSGVHGCPILAAAINKHATVAVEQINKPEVSIDFKNFGHVERININELYVLKSSIESKKSLYDQGQLDSIRDVLQSKYDLAKYTVAKVLSELKGTVDFGLSIVIDSMIPMQSGMGSSGSCIVGLIASLSKILDMPMSKTSMHELATRIESFQHGTSSGVDPYVAIHGGSVLYDTVINKRKFEGFNFLAIHTGVPQSTTGECVSHTKKFFTDSSLLDDFTYLVKKIDNSMQYESLHSLSFYIKMLNKLLTTLNIVPRNIINLIAEIEQTGGAAKVCGGGAILGNNAGTVLALGDCKEVSSIARKYNFSVEEVNISQSGVMFV